MAQRLLTIVLVALFVLLPITPETSDQRSRGAAHAQPPACVSVSPKCVAGERAACERGYCTGSSGQILVGCVKVTCVPLYDNTLPRTIKRQCDRRPTCGAGRVAICTSRGDCARTLRGPLVNGCLNYACVSRL
jgi:hypothetical protein